MGTFFVTFIVKRIFEFVVFSLSRDRVIVVVAINWQYLHTIHMFRKQIYIMAVRNDIILIKRI